MLLKRGKIVRLKGDNKIVLLRRILDRDFPNICDVCKLPEKSKAACQYMEVDCTDYDSLNYSYVVERMRKWKKKVVK